MPVRTLARTYQHQYIGTNTHTHANAPWLVHKPLVLGGGLELVKEDKFPAHKVALQIVLVRRRKHPLDPPKASACMHAFTYVCMYVYVYIYVCVCVQIYIYIYTYIYEYARSKCVFVHVYLQTTI